MSNNAMPSPDELCRCNSGKQAKVCCLPILLAGKAPRRKAHRRNHEVYSKYPHAAVTSIALTIRYIKSLQTGGLTPPLNSLSVGTYRGNPLQITKDQHIVGRKHIEIFSVADKVEVLVLNRPKPKIERRSPKNHRFCAERVWSQDAERWMGKIEDDFYQAVEDSLNSGIIEDQEAITEYHALCCARSIVSAKPPASQSEILSEEIPDASRDALDFLGKGYYSTQGDETRTIAAGAVSMLMDVIQHNHDVHNCKWGIVDIPANAVVLPDFFGTLDVPVRPDVVFRAYRGLDKLPQRRSDTEEITSYVDRMTKYASRFIAARSRDDLQRLLSRYRRNP